MLDFHQFEFLTFDCYGTLIHWEEGILRCLHLILAAHGKETDDATILQLYGEFEAEAEQGEYLPYREVLQRVVGGFGQRLGFSPTEKEARSLAESLQTWQPWPDTPAALQRLKSRYRLAVISNVDDDLFAATQPQLGIEFDHVITAQQAKAYKPSLQIFELAFRTLGVPASKILHVGQSIYHDVVPARALGLASVWVNRPSVREGVGAVKTAEAHPDLEVASLAELAALAVN
jgi:2-haloacid dehalogenase